MDYPHDLEGFISELRQVHLTSAERRRIRGRLIQGINHSPEPWYRRVIEWWEMALKSRVHRPRSMVAAILVIFLWAGAGVAESAEYALPGESLYSIKINLTEEIRSSFALSHEDRAVWNIERVTRRLEEVEQLAARTNVPAGVEAELQKRFQKSVERANKSINRIEAKGQVHVAARLSSSLEGMLQAHEQILAAINHPITKQVVSSVHSNVQTTAQVRAHQEAQVSEQAQPDVEAAATGRLHSTENKLAEVKKFIQHKGAELGPEATAEANAKVAAAESVVAEGQAKLTAALYAEAFRLFQEAHRIAQQAKHLVIARSELHVGVSINPPALQRAAEPPPGLLKKVDPTVTSTPAEDKVRGSEKPETGD